MGSKYFIGYYHQPVEAVGGGGGWVGRGGGGGGLGGGEPCHFLYFEVEVVRELVST